MEQQMDIQVDQKSNQFDKKLDKMLNKYQIQALNIDMGGMGLSKNTEKKQHSYIYSKKQIVNAVEWCKDSVNKFVENCIRDQEIRIVWVQYIISLIDIEQALKDHHGKIHQKATKFFLQIHNNESLIVDLEFFLAQRFGECTFSQGLFFRTKKIKQKELPNQLSIQEINKLLCVLSEIPTDQSFFIKDLARLFVCLQLSKLINNLCVLGIVSSSTSFIAAVRYGEDQIITFAEPFFKHAFDCINDRLNIYSINLNIQAKVFSMSEQTIIMAKHAIFQRIGNKFIKIKSKGINKDCTENIVVPIDKLNEMCLTKGIYLQIQQQSPNSKIFFIIQSGFIHLTDCSKKQSGFVFTETHESEIKLYGLYDLNDKTCSVAFLNQDLLDQKNQGHSQQKSDQIKQSPQSEGIIIDKRKDVKQPMKYPYNSICKLILPDNEFGTAFFLKNKDTQNKGSRFLMTCAHNFLTRQRSYLAPHFLQKYLLCFSAYSKGSEGPSYDCRLQPVKIKIKNVYIHPLYQYYLSNYKKKLSKEDLQRNLQEKMFFDIAIIELYAPFFPQAKPPNSSDENIPFGFDLLRLTIQLDKLQKLNIEIAGFAINKDNIMQFQCKNHYKKNNQYLYLVQRTKNQHMSCFIIIHKISTEPGNSGSPCYIVETKNRQNKYKLIGVHTKCVTPGVRNSATDIYSQPVWEWLTNIQGFDEVEGIEVNAEPKGSKY